LAFAPPFGRHEETFKVRMRHPIRGLLVGPLVAPIAYWIGVTAYAWGSDFRLDWFKALRELAAITVFGLPIAYAATLAWGAPMLYALNRAGWLRAATLVAAGAAGGTFVAVLFAFYQQGALIRVHMPLPGGAVLGALVGGACWWAGQGRIEQSGPAA
jgi:hypothetical protein